MDKREDRSLRKPYPRRRAEVPEPSAGGWWASGFAFRIACAFMGAATGCLLALLIGLAGSAAGHTYGSLDTLLGAGAVSGALCGALAPNILLKAMTGLAHFLSGLLSALGGGDPPDTPRGQGWLLACAVMGGLYVLGLSIGWELLR